MSGAETPRSAFRYLDPKTVLEPKFQSPITHLLTSHPCNNCSSPLTACFQRSNQFNLDSVCLQPPAVGICSSPVMVTPTYKNIYINIPPQSVSVRLQFRRLAQQAKSTTRLHRSLRYLSLFPEHCNYRSPSPHHPPTTVAFSPLATRLPFRVLCLSPSPPRLPYRGGHRQFRSCKHLEESTLPAASYPLHTLAPHASLREASGCHDFPSTRLRRSVPHYSTPS